MGTVAHCGSALAACGARTLTANFDGSGVARFVLRYADVGRVAVDASYSGSAADGNPGLLMLGSVSAVAAPQDFEFSELPAGVRTAGQPFGVAIRARNAAGEIAGAIACAQRNGLKLPMVKRD